MSGQFMSGQVSRDPINQPALAPKVFGIGFQKTGTSSLGRALEDLGYSVYGGFDLTPVDDSHEFWQHAQNKLTQYDAFQDMPWPVLYEYLDEIAPGSKFILTVRHPVKWMQSVVSHFGSTEIANRKWIYGLGAPLEHEDVYLSRYLGHNERVRAHFSERPEDLLVMDIEKGDGWEALCTFLDKPMPAARFPKKNSSTNRRIRSIRRAVQSRLGLEDFLRRRHTRRTAGRLRLSGKYN